MILRVYITCIYVRTRIQSGIDKKQQRDDRRRVQLVVSCRVLESVSNNSNKSFDNTCGLTIGSEHYTRVVQQQILLQFLYTRFVNFIPLMFVAHTSQKKKKILLLRNVFLIGSYQRMRGYCFFTLTFIFHVAFRIIKFYFEFIGV